MDSEAQAAAEVMARYCRGEAAAFQRLYTMLGPRILGYLAGLMGDKAAAEDALQVTFLKVHEARGSYILGANPIPWIYTIAHRTGLDEMRKRKRSRVRLSADGNLDTTAAEPVAHISGAPADARDDEGEHSGTASAAGALAALNQLPENQRLALILTKVHGRTTAEAAMITGTTPGAIKQRAHRAYVTLRQALGVRPRAPAGKEMA